MTEYESREGREEEKEVQIYPDDIQIIDDPNQWTPSRRQILVYGEIIGYNLLVDPREFFKIAEKNLMKPLPNEWRRAFKKYDLEFMYIDITTNEIHLFTDIEEKAKEELEKERAKYKEQLKKNIFTDEALSQKRDIYRAYKIK